jgi:uncharacterized membrane protein
LVNKLLYIIFVLAIILIIGCIYYINSRPNMDGACTEFYILGPGGRAEGYPTSLAAGQQAQVIVGLVNRERRTVNYTIRVKTGDVVQRTVCPIILEDGQKWEKPVVFVLYAPHEREQLQFLLFRQGDTAAYRSLCLWVTVRGPAAGNPAEAAAAASGKSLI